MKKKRTDKKKENSQIKDQRKVLSAHQMYHAMRTKTDS